VELTYKQQKNLRKKIKRGGPVSREEELSKEMIRQILNVSDLKLKTLILFILSSGVRLGEALALNLEDVKVSKDRSYGIVKINAAISKNGVGRVTFINNEAVESLMQWITKRDDYIKHIIKVSRGQFRVTRSSSDKRIFPFNQNAAQRGLNTALKSAGLFEQDGVTSRKTIHYHLLRKYFVTQMNMGGISSKHVEFFVGHLTSLDRTYNVPSQAQLLEIYLKAEPQVRVYDESAEEVAEAKKQIGELSVVNQELRIRNLENDNKFKKMEDELSAMKAMVTKMVTPEGLLVAGIIKGN
jgi:integrase